MRVYQAGADNVTELWHKGVVTKTSDLSVSLTSLCFVFSFQACQRERGSTWKSCQYQTNVVRKLLPWQASYVQKRECSPFSVKREGLSWGPGSLVRDKVMQPFTEIKSIGVTLGDRSMSWSLCCCEGLSLVLQVLPTVWRLSPIKHCIIQAWLHNCCLHFSMESQGQYDIFESHLSSFCRGWLPTSTSSPQVNMSQTSVSTKRRQTKLKSTLH